MDGMLGSKPPGTKTFSSPARLSVPGDVQDISHIAG
jgi:hypothetical protein